MKLGTGLAGVLVAVALVWLGSGGCGDSSVSQMGGRDAMYPLDCLGIRNCVREACQSGMDQNCVKPCLDKATSTAQVLYRMLNTCLITTCCTDAGGCGGGEPTCSAAGTPACDMCTCHAQCDGTGSCRDIAKSCYGIEPDCSACL